MMADRDSNAVPSGVSLLAQMRPALLRYFRRKTGSARDAEDLTQDVLMRSLSHASWQSVEEAKGYVFRSAVNRWVDHYRHRHVQPPTVELSSEIEAALGSDFTPEHVLMSREELNQIFQALEQMNERTRAVLILVKVEQTKVATVAEMLGISVRAVNKHLAKGIEVLIRHRKRQEWLR